MVSHGSLRDSDHPKFSINCFNKITKDNVADVKKKHDINGCHLRNCMQTMIKHSHNKFISVMPQVKEYESKLSSLTDWWGKIALVGKINSHSLASIILDDMQSTKEKFSVLHNKLIDNLLLEQLKRVLADNTAKSQVTIDILIRNLFERTADVGFLATDEDIRQFLAHTQQETDKRDFIEARLDEYVKKYSVYDEIVILDIAGNVQANLDKSNLINVCKDSLFEETLNTNQDYVETFGYSDLQKTKANALIYSCKITENNQPGSNVLGVLCLCFHFDNEMNAIFNHLASDAEHILLLMSASGHVIASSEDALIPLNTHFTFHATPQVRLYQGTEYLVTCCQTEGYQGFSGLGWWSMAMTPLHSAFNHRNDSMQPIDSNINLMTSQLFSSELKEIYQTSKIVNDDLSLIVLNGQVTALKKQAAEFMPVLEAIKQIGKNTEDIFSNSVNDLQLTVISAHMNDVMAMATLATNIMDRNLYERANDARWWALTSIFRQVLTASTISAIDAQRLSDTLHYINQLYTVYTNIYLYDRNGYIVALSDAEQSSLLGKKLDRDSGATQTLLLTDSQQYAVSPFLTTPLYDNRETYIYNAAITATDQQQVIGGVGIVFDSEPEFKAILTDTLPKDEHGHVAKGCFALFVERTGKIIATTEYAPFVISDVISDVIRVDDDLLDTQPGKSISKMQKIKSQHYILGVAATSGYREYKTTGDYTNDVLAFIFIPF